MLFWARNTGAGCWADYGRHRTLEQAKVDLTATATDLAVGQADLDRALRGDTRLTLSGQRDGAAFGLAGLKVENRALNADLQGRIDRGASLLDGRFDLPDLAAVRPGFRGGVSGTVGLREDGPDRHLTLDAETRNLAFGAEATDRMLAGRHVVQMRALTTPDTVSNVCR